MKSTFTCPHHPTEQLTWICLEQSCSTRLLCSTCAVKSHDKFHRVEEIKTFETKGFKGLVADSLVSHLLNSKEFDFYESTLDNSLKEMKATIDADFQMLKNSFADVINEVQSHNSSLVEKANKFEESDKKFKNGFSNSEELTSFLNEEISKAHSAVNEVNVGDCSAIKFKGELLEILASNFIRLKNLYLSNSYLSNLSSLLQKQADSIVTVPEMVTEKAKYLSHVDVRMRREWNAVEINFTRNLSALSSHLNNLANPEKPLPVPLQPQQQFIQQVPQQALQYIQQIPQQVPQQIPQQIQFQPQQPSTPTMNQTPKNNQAEDSATKRYRMMQFVQNQQNVLLPAKQTRNQNSNSKNPNEIPAKREFAVNLNFGQQENVLN